MENNELNKQLQVLGEGVLKVSPTGNIITQGPVSELLPTLGKRVVDSQLVPLSVSYITAEDLSEQTMTNGMFEIKYELPLIPGTRKSLDDVTNADANDAQEPNVVYEIFELTQADEDNIGIKIYESSIADFGLNSTSAVQVLNTVANGANDQINGQMLENKKLNFLFTDTNANEVVDTSVLTTTIDKSKAIDIILTKYGTTSTETLGAQTINGKSYKFKTRFDSSEFILYLNSKFAADYTYDVQAGIFNYGTYATWKLNKIRKVDFASLEIAKTITDIADYEWILFHPKAVKTFRHYSITTMIPTASAWKVLNYYKKQNVFKNKAYPIVLGYNTPPVIPPTADSKKK